ncbi:response regulator transcription factor, partial [Chloroflexota bacterium]
VETGDEVGIVARTFNDMAERVEQHAHALEDSKKDLELKIQERTRQVQQMAAVRGQMLERLISVQAEERQRLSLESSDEGCHALSAIMIDLARAIQMSAGEAAELQDETYSSLTRREKEVLRLSAAGRTNREMAEELFLSTRTVEKYRQTVMHKLGLDRREQLTKYALRKGLIDFVE